MKPSNGKVGVMIITAVLLLSAVMPFITLAQSSSVNNSAAIAITDTRLWDVNKPLSAAQKAQINASGITLTQAQIAEIKANMLKLKANDAKNAGESVQAHSKALMDAGKVPVISGPTTIHAGTNTGKSSITSDLVSPLSVGYGGANDYGFSGPLPNGGNGMGTFIQENDGSYVRQQNVMNGLGWGTNDGWAWQGYTFVWNGPTGYYNIDIQGSMFGLTECDYLGGGFSTAASHENVAIKDITAHTDPHWGSEITQSASLPIEWHTSPTSIGQSLPQTLTNGHQYTAYVYLDGQATVYGWAAAMSDFYSQGQNSGRLQFNSVTIQ